MPPAIRLRIRNDTPPRIRGPYQAGDLVFGLFIGGGLALKDAGKVGGLVEEAVAADAASAARGGVYTLRDEAGNVVRTGRTKDLAAREVQHANDPVLGDYHFNVEYRTDVYAEQRGLEDVLYSRYPGAQVASGGFNKIRAMDPSHPNRGLYLQAAADFLARHGGL